ncbi:cytochrome P450 [Pavlovales sp. CCMP2436]|nr:cytochrome P450 [Pavlovales sp. CCMP2436]
MSRALRERATWAALLLGAGLLPRAQGLGAARSALSLLRHGSLVDLARAHVREPVFSLRLNGRDVHLVSSTAVARQVCVERASVFVDRNDPSSSDPGLVSAVGSEWSRNRAALRNALSGAEARTLHSALTLAACERLRATGFGFRPRTRVGEAAILVRSLAANVVAEVILGQPPVSANGTHPEWRPLRSAPFDADFRTSQPVSTFKRLAARARLSSAGVLARVLVFVQQLLSLARPSRFFDFAKSFTAPRVGRVARIRSALCGVQVDSALSDSELAVLSALLALFASDDPELLPRAQAEAELVLSSPRLDFRSSFLCACLHEGMRLNPPAPLLFRVARVDVSLLDTTGVTIVNVRAGSAIVMAAAALASDRDAWDAPGQFRPERWLSTQDVRSSVDGGDGGGGGASRVTSRGVPTEFSFGAGPRGCAGSQLAMSIAPVILAVALREVRSLER